MTVSTLHTVKQYNGNGFITTFVVDFQFIEQTDLLVTLINTLGAEIVQVIATNYTVTGGKNSNGQPGTGSVIMAIAPASGESLRIERVTPVIQDVDFNLGSNFNPESVEAMADRDRLIVQEVKTLVDRAVTLSTTDQLGGVSAVLPPAVPLLFLRWDALGLALESGGGFTWKGQWTTSAPYNADDYVQNLGSTYIAKTTHVAGASTQPGVGGSWPTVWDLVASKGDLGSPGLDAGIPWNFDSTITMANPGSANLRLNNASLASVTAIAVNYNCAMTGNPLVTNWVLAWDDSTTPSAKAFLLIRDTSNPENFAIYLVNAALTDNSTWAQIPVTHVSSSGALTGQISVQFSRVGDRGAAGAGSGDMLAANNLSDVANAATAFANIKQAATTVATGVSELATDAEAQAKSDTVRTLTPSNLAALTTSTTFVGFIETATDTEAAQGTDTTRAVTAAQIHEARVDVVSAGTTNIGAAASNYVRITGSVTITAFDTVAAGVWRDIRFSAALTLTHGAALLLPSQANIVTAADDCCFARSEGSGNWIIMWYQKANGQPLALPASSGTPSPPMGRLTVSSGVPVMTGTSGGVGTIFYTPYIGRHAPLYNGSIFVMTDLGSELSQSTADATKSPAACTANKNYDIFVWDDAGTKRATRGPAWSSDTSRGSGAGTTELTRVQGFWVNNQAISNGPAINKGLYVGTIRTNGSSLVDWIYGAVASGGTAGSFGVWNMYNRVDVNSYSGDNTNSWTYNSTTWRSANNSAGLRTSFIMGMAEDAFDADYMIWQRGAPVGTSSSVVPLTAIGYDSTSSPAVGRYTIGQVSTGEAPTVSFQKSNDIGWHFVQAIERASQAAAVTFAGDLTPTQAIPISTGMFWRGRM